jgi:DNA/RNA endonuclease G (NUC1)
MPQSILRSRTVIVVAALSLMTIAALIEQTYSPTKVRAASPFTAGNIVIYRVGDGSAALSGIATPVFLDEYTPAGAFAQTVALPTATSSPNRRLFATGNATTEGLMTRSADGQYLILEGYDTTAGTALPGSGSTINRVIGRVDAGATINTTTALNDPSANIRGAASTNGSDLWISCSSNGSRYAALGTVGTSTQLSTSVTNLRGTAIFNNQLYISSASGTFLGVATVGSGTPTTSGQTITALPGFPTTGTHSSYQFAFANASTLYVADDGGASSGGGIQKWTLSGGTWSLAYILLNNGATTTGVRGLTVDSSGANPVIYATTTTTSANSLIKVTDTGASSTATTLATAPANTAFRGVALAPSNPNQAIVTNCPGNLNTTQGTATFANVSATDPDGRVVNASILSGGAAGITLDNFVAAPSNNTAATATLNVANTTAPGTYNVVIRYTNNDSPTPQTADCTVVVKVTPPNQPITPNCPTPLTTAHGAATSEGVSATDPDGRVTSATITSSPVAGITLDNFVAAPSNNTAATATLNVANTTAVGTYNVVIQYSNNDSPTPQTATCTVVVTVTNPPIVPSCPTPLVTAYATAASEGVSATDPDGVVTSASITSTPVAGITLDNFVPSSGNNVPATATLNVANTTASGTYNVTIQYANNDSPTPQTATCTVVVTVQPPPPPPNNVVISQVYGGGGNTDADFKNDFIELVNHSNAAVSLNGWSVQYATSNQANWQVTSLPAFTLQPGQYFLIQEAAGAGGTTDLPPADATGLIAMGATAGKVALVNNTTTLTTNCPNAGAGGIVDFIGYGTADCFEGSGAAAATSNTTSAQRRNEGCADTNDNLADFVAAAPNPRNSSSPTHDCTALFGFGSANPSSVVVGNNVALSVDVAPAQNPSSTAIAVTADLSSIGGSPNQSFTGSGNVFTFNAIVSNSTTGGFKSLPVTITDAQARSFNTSIVLSVLPAVADHITISQIYGGGGNSNAVYQNDYVELYNPTGSSVSVTGWSIQYASATGTSWTNKQPIGGTIGPGQYLLVGLASGGANGAPLPPAQISGGINMSATAGKVALVKNGDSLTGGCPLGSDPDIVDFVGYGSTANCHEGTANAPAPSNTTAIFRNAKPPQDPNQGAQDTDQNGNDFTTGAPNPRQTAPIAELGPWVASTDPGTNGTTVPHDASVLVTFSEPVNVDPGWFSITCNASGSHNDATEAHTTDAQTYAFTPNTNFQFGEQCTVTVFKTKIHDQDTNDSAPNTDTLLDDYTWSFTVVADNQQPPPYPPSVHLTMGDPGCNSPMGCAVASTSQPNNFLMSKPTYALSYNRDKGTPNWVSWHLEPAWYGTLARVDVFRADPAVPSDWYRVQSFDYSGSGFDRGHMTPNADRDNQFRVPINQETYLMSNMVPQAPDNNQGPWAALEADLRSISDAGNELYIVSGPLGVGGTGSNGGTTTSVANGHVTVPAYTWKVALVLPKADGDDVSRVTCSTRTIAVLMPNAQGIRSNPWQTYLTTVDNIEQLTGFDFYSNLPPAVQACIEAGSNGTNPPGTANQSAMTTEDNSVTVTLTGLQPTNAALTFSIVNNPSHGQVGTVSSSTCANGSCTATVSYSPNADFNGTDSFTFKANNGTSDSNTSTVTIGISEVNDSPTAADDNKSTQEDTPLNFPASDLTANDSAGPANESTQVLTVTSVAGGANTHGTVSLNSGMVNYTPAANYNGAASFTYTVCDDGTTNGSPDAKCATATVNISIEAVNDAPSADSQSVSTNEDTSLPIILTGSDVETMTASLHFQVTQGPSHGSLSGTAPNLSYSPAANYNGADTFKFTVTDTGDGSSPALTSNEATVSITVNPVNDAPSANSQSLATTSNTPVGITLTGSDIETPGPALTFTVTSGPSHGSLSGSGANRTYSPGMNFAGTDSFRFTVTDTGDGTSPALTSSEATVSITVNDTVPPVITLNGNAISLWPLNKSLQTISVADLVAGASDNFDPSVNLNSVVIASVSSDEGTAASGDIVIGGDCKSVQLRATRNGNGDGRVYTITFRARDAAGNTSFVTAKVTVPHDQGNGAAVDSGVAYTVNSSCP